MYRKLGLFLIIIASLMGCQSKQSSRTSEKADLTQYPDQEGWNSTVISSRAGRVNAIIKYGHMQKFSQQHIVKFDQGVKVDFFDKEGRHTYLLTCERGLLNEKTNDIEALGNVIAVSDSGVTLKTEKLQWKECSKKIISDDFVTITTQKDTLYGVGFESDQYLSNWVIKKPWGVSQRRMNLEERAKLPSSYGR